MIESAYLWLSTFSGAKYSGWVICMDELYSTVLSLGAGKHTESFQKEIETGTHGISQQWQWQQNRRNLIPCARNLNTHPSDQFLKAAVRDQEPESMQVTLTWKSPKGRAPGLLEVRVLPWSIHGHDCDKTCVLGTQVKVTTSRSTRYEPHFTDANGRTMGLIPGISQFREKLENLLLFSR